VAHGKNFVLYNIKHKAIRRPGQVLLSHKTGVRSPVALPLLKNMEISTSSIKRNIAGSNKKWMALIFELENKKFLTIWEL